VPFPEQRQVYAHLKPAAQYFPVAAVQINAAQLKEQQTERT
jgi:hypothetical protein